MVRMSRCGSPGSPRWKKNVKEIGIHAVNLWNKPKMTVTQVETAKLSTLNHIFDKARKRR